MTTPTDAVPPARAAMHRSRQRLHPLVAAAALSVTAVSLTGIAAMTGLLSGASSHGLATPASDHVATAPGVGAAKPPAPQAPVARRPTSSDRSYAPTGSTAPSLRAVRVRHASDMGTVESVRAVAQPAASTGIGTIGGSVIGGALGSRIGNGNGRAAMAALGAIGGGMLGHEVEQRINGARVYDVTLRMDNGALRTVRYERDPGLRVGERVRAGDVGLHPAQRDMPETPPFVRIGAPT